MVKIQIQTTIIPASVLKGQIPSFLAVHNEFINRTMQFYLKKIYDSYYERSHLDDEPDMRTDKQGYNPISGREDDLGDSWIQLRPKTYRLKRKLNNKEPLTTYLESRTSFAAKETLKRMANIDYDSGDGINIRTGALLASFFPGPVVDGKLTTREDQKISKDESKISFETLVDYFDEIQKSPRPILTDENQVAWINEAIAYGMQRAEVVYIQLRDQLKNRKRK